MLEWISRKTFVTTFLPITILLIAACGGSSAILAPEPTSTEPPVNTPAVLQIQEATETPDAPQPISVLDTTDIVEPWRVPQVAESTSTPEAPIEVSQPEPQVEETPEKLTVDLTDDEIVAAYERVSVGLYEAVLPSVVQIGVAQEADSAGFPFGSNPDDEQEFFSSGEGSGFVWSDEGYIVTNRHVIANADLVIVSFADGTRAEAEVVGLDADSDLAVLKVDLPANRLPAVTLGSSSNAKVGQFVAAIGNPFGQEFTLTTGIVSAVGRTINSGSSQFSIPQVIQTDAAINPGNSGGPLLNRQGEVIGVNTQIISRSGSNSGVGFAVPIDVAKRVVPALIENGSFEYSWLGISGGTLVPEVAEAMNLPEGTRGALIISIAEGGPADRAGLRENDRTESIGRGNVSIGGDVVVAINGTPITEMDALISYLVVNTSPGDTVTFEVLRDGGERAQIDVTLGTRPAR